ncbi:hypothetical protein PNEG_03353 [Pneumocystis murina B123]|uniref:polynucleotide adenylyltransferase n=1 Tax=Pneumocystis murina (strain B123) TaxID=1069680 RepID=M7NM14_PNEMU|nr:hypothetical protein PNEG_03353 [Pneumocystis murina B123]EMR08181.1 hypothetical protein PNEG_03353 [Pneumocystis murina B123]
METTKECLKFNAECIEKDYSKHLELSQSVSQLNNKIYSSSISHSLPSISEQSNKKELQNISSLRDFLPCSSVSESLTTIPSKMPLITYPQCPYETALVNSRRRIPYSSCIERPIDIFEWKTRSSLSTKNEDLISSDILQLYETLLPSSENNSRWTKFLKKLTTILQKEWPDKKITVQAFGSTVNQLCTSESDVDVCITTIEKEHANTCKLAKVLANYGMERVVCVPHAKVPIVKIWDPKLSVACDMNINNTLALENTRMIKIYVEIDPRVRPLAMIIKYWAKKRILNDAAGGGTLSSYTWICMIINFLQMRKPPILPSLHQLPHEQNESSLIEGIDVSFFDDIDALKGFGEKNTESLGGLLFAFFRRYAYEFDYDHCVISVRHGHYLSKSAKGWHLTQNNRLCVEEPFNTKRNLGNTADDTTVKGLQIEFRRAFHLIANHCDLKEVCADYIFTNEENIYKINPCSHPLYYQISKSSYSSNALHPKNDTYYYKNNYNIQRFQYQQCSNYMNYFSLNTYGLEFLYFSNPPDKSIYYDSKSHTFFYYISGIGPDGLMKYYPVVKENHLLSSQDIFHSPFPLWKRDQNICNLEGHYIQKTKTSLNCSPYSIYHEKESTDSESFSNFSFIPQFIPLAKDDVSCELAIAEEKELNEFHKEFISNSEKSCNIPCKYLSEDQVSEFTPEAVSLDNYRNSKTIDSYSNFYFVPEEMQLQSNNFSSFYESKINTSTILSNNG